MTKKDKNIDLEVVKVGFANGVAEGFPLNDKQKSKMIDNLAELGMMNRKEKKFFKKLEKDL